NDFFARVARLARKMGSRFVLDTSGESLHLGLREGAYLVKPNFSELCDLAGRELGDEPEEAAAAMHLVNSDQAEVVVLSPGPAGARAARAAGARPVRAPSVRARGRVGAGYSMLAGLVLGLARPQPLDLAVRLGIAAGAAATLNPGTQLCSREDTERL